MRSTRRLRSVLAALVFATWATPAVATQPTEGTTREEVRKELSEAIDAIKDYTVEQRDDAVQQARAVMDDLDMRIERREESLRRQWHQMNESARDRARATLSSLKQQRNELAEWYGGLQHSSDRAWEDIKLGFSNAYSELEAAWEDAESESAAEQ